MLLLLSVSFLLLGAGAVAQPALAPGSTVRDELAPGDSLLSDGSYYDLYTFWGTPATPLLLTLRSSAFDAYLAVGRLDEDSTFVFLAADNDGGGRTDARVRFTPPKTGRYVVRANSLKAGEAGTYTLSVERATTTPQAPRTIALGQTVEGFLEETDRRLPDGSYYDEWVFQAAVGAPVVATLHAEAFDAFLTVGRYTPDGVFHVLLRDDDSGTGTDAELRLEVAVNGPVVFRANSVDDSALGPYSLTVHRAPRPTPTLGADTLRNQRLTPQAPR